jgi:putative membrane protein
MMVMIGALVCGVGAAYAQGGGYGGSTGTTGGATGTTGGATGTTGGPTGTPGTTGTTGGAMDTTGAQKQPFSMKDRQFLTKAASGSIAEIRGAQLAVDKAQNPELKQAAQRILDDHQKASDQLKQIAAAHDVALPTEMTGEDKQAIQKLQKASGSEFDRVYMREMMKDHEKDITEFQRAAREVQDPQLREFATNTLPVLRQHHQLIMGMEGGKGMKMPSGGAGTSPSGSDVERR